MEGGIAKVRSLLTDASNALAEIDVEEPLLDEASRDIDAALRQLDRAEDKWRQGDDER